MSTEKKLWCKIYLPYLDRHFLEIIKNKTLLIKQWLLFSLSIQGEMLQQACMTKVGKQLLLGLLIMNYDTPFYSKVYYPDEKKIFNKKLVFFSLWYITKN